MRVRPDAPTAKPNGGSDMSRYRTPVPTARVDQYAEILSQGLPMMAAGRAMGLTKGETVSTLRRIKLDLGGQAQ